MGFLAQEKQDPEAPDKMIPDLILQCRGVITDAKKEILNAALKIFSQGLYLQKYGKIDASMMSPEERAQCEYQPTTMLTIYKQLFSYFKKKGVMIEQQHFKGFPASYDTVMNDRIQSTAEI